VEELLASVTDLDVTYKEVGQSFSDVCPSGYQPGHYVMELGKSEGTFERAVAALEAWGSHQTRWTKVFPEFPSIVVGESVIVMIGFNTLSIAAPCRIVRVVDDEDRFGFAYGTLPGHPEQGEESFLITRSSDGSVTFVIKSFSRPQGKALRLASPISQLIQSRVTKQYLNAMENFSLIHPSKSSDQGRQCPEAGVFRRVSDTRKFVDSVRRENIAS